MPFLPVPFTEGLAPNELQLLFPLSSSRAADPSHQVPDGTRRRKAVDYLPSCPNISLGEIEVLEYMQKELGTPILEELYPRLWLVARKSYSNINPLHLQATKGRKLFLTEDPQLHLLWKDDRIYIKPVPSWLLNYQVWLQYLSLTPEQMAVNTTDTQTKDQSSNPVVREPSERVAALGFLRSYAYLIQHHSDFVIAHQHLLLPPSVDWISWSRFIACFRNTGDHEVSGRYHYGQLRLSRLHWAVRLFRPRSASTWWFYYLPYWSMAPYMRSILAPLAFVFATFSLVLSAMQVLVSINAHSLRFSGVSEFGLDTMRSTFWVFSLSMLLSFGIFWVLLAVITTGILTWQLLWGYSHRHNALAAVSQGLTKTPGV